LDERASGGELTTEAGAFHTRFAPTGQTLTDGQTQSASLTQGWALGRGGFLRGGVEALHRSPTNRAGLDSLPPWEAQTPANLATVSQRNYA
ncbi:hypothetical protein, partial [Klebsiella pneumoniae]